MDPSSARPAVIGLGYVGLPLAAAFGAQLPTVGFDVAEARVAELRRGEDSTLELSADELAASRHLSLTSDPADLAGSDVFIITVPTPIDDAKRPDLRAVSNAARTIGTAIRPGGVVILESTVYPGVTEEVVVPIVAETSGLTYGVDFHAGYSPERINPGDRTHRLPDIVKVTSGSSPEVAEFVDGLYRLIIRAGTHRASSIAVAEAAKVIENTQRDLNIALVNELSIIFERLGIDTLEVLEAAGTKWNFLPFRPGLVGGHCISVDPYYLTHRAQQVGLHPEVVLAGRRINDEVGHWIAERLVKAMLERGIDPSRARVAILGITFKEDCPDLRNTRVIDIVTSLRAYSVDVQIADPHVDPEQARHEYDLEVHRDLPDGGFEAVVLAVAHGVWRKAPPGTIRGLLSRPDGVVFDVKGILPRDESDLRL